MRFISKQLTNLRDITRSVEFTILQLLQRNLHLGASVEFSLLSSHWFVSGVRHRFTILNLNLTVLYFRKFLNLVRMSASSRKHVLFVNERFHLEGAVSKIALSVGEPYVMGRWVGGTLTNFKKVLLAYYALLKGRSQITLTRQKWNLKKSLEGLELLKFLPGSVFFNSAKNNFWGLRESYALHIPSAAVADSDSFPANALYPVPGNDDAFGSVQFLNQLVAKMILISKIMLLLDFSKKFRGKFVNKWPNKHFNRDLLRGVSGGKRNAKSRRSRFLKPSV